MRELKFRAKRIDNKKWCYGYFWDKPLRYGHEALIFIEDAKEDSGKADTGWTSVDRKTLGQFTGLTDKIGAPIYEGDILKIENWSILFKVVFDEYYAKFTVEKIKYDGGRKMDYIPDCEIIGNIYENENLLK